MRDRVRGVGVRFYLRRRAASEEAQQPETLTGDSYTDLRRQDRGTRTGDVDTDGETDGDRERDKGQMRTKPNRR